MRLWCVAADQVPRERAARVRLQTQHARSVDTQLERLIIRRAQEIQRRCRPGIAAELPEVSGAQAAQRGRVHPRQICAGTAEAARHALVGTRERVYPAELIASAND